jgi:O-antigen ligase
MKSETKSGGEFYYTLAFGLFLGLCIWKFGNPVILDNKISTPVTPADFWNDAWPLHWSNWIFLPFAIIGGILIFQKKISWSQTKWLWLLPLIWLGWQFISASKTVDADLTAATLWQFSGCVASYFLGAFLFNNKHALSLLLIGILLAFTFCLVRAVIQKNYEFPQNHQMLVEGERAGWTNFPPETVAEMKTENIIITTNGADVANPAILAKFTKGRVNGTLVYPNALAGLILLLLPVSLALAFGSAKKIKALIRFAVIALVIFLGSAAFFWTGSKLGWLLGIGVAGIFLLRLNWPKKLKLIAVATILILGLGIFAVRFHNYFAAGATSVGARFDYWRAAVQTTAQDPVFGSGPGTFQRPYARLKSSDAEMARLAHNDYLEQFSDSGLIGGLAYSTWIFLVLTILGKKFGRNRDIFCFAIFAGLLAWFAQGFGEFSLYIPALAWMAFTLLGSLISLETIEFDKKTVTR